MACGRKIWKIFFFRYYPAFGNYLCHKIADFLKKVKKKSTSAILESNLEHFMASFSILSNVLQTNVHDSLLHDVLKFKIC